MHSPQNVPILMCASILLQSLGFVYFRVNERVLKMTEDLLPKDISETNKHFQQR